MLTTFRTCYILNKNETSQFKQETLHLIFTSNSAGSKTNGVGPGEADFAPL
jgi:hypothetical protein